jgi:hypothetical protein
MRHRLSRAKSPFFCHFSLQICRWPQKNKCSAAEDPDAAPNVLPFT